MEKLIWKILDHFACWLSNKCWQKLYKTRKFCECKKKKAPESFEN